MVLGIGVEVRLWAFLARDNVGQDAEHDELEDALLDVDCFEKEPALPADWVEAVSKQARGSAV